MTSTDKDDATPHRRGVLVAGAIVVVAGVVGLIGLADASTESDGLAALDPDLTATAVSHRTPVATAVARRPTFVSNPSVLGTLTVLAAVLLWRWTRSLRAPAVLVLAMIGSSALSSGFKALVGRALPSSPTRSSTGILLESTFGIERKRPWSRRRPWQRRRVRVSSSTAALDSVDRASRRRGYQPSPRQLWSLAGLCCAAAALLLPQLWHHDLVDLKVYRLGGSALLDDASTLYRARMSEIALPFTYPPFAGMVMIPVALLPWSLAVVLWTSASIACLAAIWRLCLIERPSNRRAHLHPAALTAAMAVSLLLEPVRQTLGYGQINLMLCALVMYDMLAARHRASRGVWVGLAAGLKLTPLVFLGLLLFTRQWRALINATASVTVTVLLGFVFAPRAAVEYWTSLLFDTTRIGGLTFAGNQSWNGFLTRISGDLHGGGPLWAGGALVIAAGGLWLSRALWLRADRLAGLSVCALIGLLCSPVSWSHHWVWVIPLGIALLTSTRAGRAHPIWTAAAWFGLFLLAPIWWPPNHDHRELAWSLVDQLPGNAYPIAALVAAALLLTGLRSDGPTGAGQPNGMITSTTESTSAGEFQAEFEFNSVMITSPPSGQRSATGSPRSGRRCHRGSRTRQRRSARRSDHRPSGRRRYLRARRFRR
jgi:alpha-1,2-mannosyltransferase